MDALRVLQDVERLCSAFVCKHHPSKFYFVGKNGRQRVKSCVAELKECLQQENGVRSWPGDLRDRLLQCIGDLHGRITEWQGSWDETTCNVNPDHPFYLRGCTGTAHETWATDLLRVTRDFRGVFHPNEEAIDDIVAECEKSAQDFDLKLRETQHKLRQKHTAAAASSLRKRSLTLHSPTRSNSSRIARSVPAKRAVSSTADTTSRRRRMRPKSTNDTRSSSPTSNTARKRRKPQKPTKLTHTPSDSSVSASINLPNSPSSSSSGSVQIIEKDDPFAAEIRNMEGELTDVWKWSQETEYEVEEILDKRVDPFLHVSTYFVKWKGWSEEYNSWEPKNNLIGCDHLLKAFRKKKRSRR